MTDLLKPLPLRPDAAGSAFDSRHIRYDRADPRWAEPMVDLAAEGLRVEAWYARTDGGNEPYNQPIVGAVKTVAARAGVARLLHKAEEAVAPRGLRINAVAPGRVVTEMMMAAVASVGGAEAVAAGLPLRRMGRPEEVAEATVWLASDQSAYVVGHVLATDGGFLSA